MVEQPTDGLLRDLIVDQAGAEGVAPLVRRDMDLAATFVANIADAQPFSQFSPKGRGAKCQLAVGVAGRPRQQKHRVVELVQPTP